MNNFIFKKCEFETMTRKSAQKFHLTKWIRRSANGSPVHLLVVSLIVTPYTALTSRERIK